MPYPEGTPVLVRYPRNRAEEQGDRAAWPWLPGVIEEACGDGEWLVVVESPEVATLEDGSPTPDGTPEDDLYHPLCFRDSSEIREAQ